MPTFHKSSIIKIGPRINSDLGLLIVVANCTAFFVVAAVQSADPTAVSDLLLAASLAAP